MATVKEIQKRLVKALETEQDTAPILKELADQRAKDDAEKELAEAREITAKRQVHRDKAEAVKAKVQKQGAAIDAVLKLRDTLVSQLETLAEPMKELKRLTNASWEREPGECYIFNDIRQFAATVREIPKGYLPDGFGVPFLEMKDGQVAGQGQAAAAYSYFMSALGILTSFEKRISSATLSPSGEFDGDLGDKTMQIETICRVCQHPEREAIDKALQANRSLRDIETEFNVPRSTLSRHKNRCLKLGPHKVEPESPAVSANQTFFRG